MKTTALNQSSVWVPLRLGAAYGALWSLAPGVFSELLGRPGEAATVILSGAVTGVLVACALAPLLVRVKRWPAILLGVLSLPLGAGWFGFVASWVHWTVMKLTGTHYRFVMQIVESPGFVFEPLKNARDYALWGTFSPLGLAFIPLAILTTLHLRGKILRSGSSSQS